MNRNYSNSTNIYKDKIEINFKKYLPILCVAIPTLPLMTTNEIKISTEFSIANISTIAMSVQIPIR